MSSAKKFQKLSLIALVLAFLGGSMLMGCSSSDESSSDDCNCAENDWNCKDRCQTNL